VYRADRSPLLQSCYQVLLNSAGNLASRSICDDDDDSIFTGSDDSHHHRTTLSDAYYAETSPFLAPAEVDGSEFEEMTVQDESSALVKRASARQRIEMYSMPLAASVSNILFEPYVVLRELCVCFMLVDRARLISWRCLLLTNFHRVPPGPTRGNHTFPRALRLLVPSSTSSNSSAVTATEATSSPSAP
jgi:hypothetical protein